MLQIKEKTKKWYSLIGIFGLLFVQLFPLGVSAATITIPDSLVSGLTNSSVSNNPINGASNDSSSAINKQQGPKVDVTFASEGGGKPGTKMTATANPSFFNNASDPKNLYFTWYLKRSGCRLTDENHPNGKKDNGDPISPDPSLPGNCDLNGDGIITVDDWKLAAAKIIENSPSYKAASAPDDNWNGDNSVDAPNCYAQDPKSGLIYELDLVKDLTPPCPENYHRECASSNQTASCDVLNPAYDPVAGNAAQTAIDVANAWNTDPAHLPYPRVVPPPYPIAVGDPAYDPAAASAAQTAINAANAWNTANAPRIVPAPYPISKTKPRQTGKFCALTGDTDTFCKISDNNNDNDLKNYKATVACLKGDTSFCVKDSSNIFFPDSGDLTGAIFSKSSLCSSLNVNPNTPPILAPVPAWLDSQDSKFNVVEGQTCDQAREKVLSGIPNVESSCTFVKDKNVCKHLFLPELPGLGVDKFVWTYSFGDQVGVVVEGDSAFTSGHADASFKRMWAFSKDTCSFLEKMGTDPLATEDASGAGRRGFYLEGNGGVECDLAHKEKCTGFLTADIDLNSCLGENLLDPNDNGAGDNSKLTAQLTVDPANPINDPNGRGDTLTVTATSSNTQDRSGLFYTWSVQKSLDASNAPNDSTNWKDITTPLTTTPTSVGSFSDTDLTGLGKKELAINLNIKDPANIGTSMSKPYDGGAFYLRIKVNIKGGAVDGSQDAIGTIIVRVGAQQNKMVIYPVIANNAGMLSLNNGADVTPFCNDSAGKESCPVTKNEILGISIPKNIKSGTNPFTWTVNGNPISCSSSVSGQCSSGNVLFFPILGNDGESVDVVAKGQDKNGEAIEINRHFVIIPPQIQITAQDQNAWPKLLGYYRDLMSGDRTPNYSTQVLETNAGKTIMLGATFYPAWKAGQAGFDWAIDGQVLPQYQNQKQIQIFVDKFSGESYNIGLVALYSPGSNDQVNNVRKALLKNWGISPEDVIEQSDSANVQLNVVSDSPSALSSVNQNSLSASLITHLPEQLIFLFKLSITSVLLLLAAGVLFAFIPETLFREEK